MKLTLITSRRHAAPVAKTEAEDRQQRITAAAASALLAGVDPERYRQCVAGNPVGLAIADAMDAILAKAIADGQS